MYFARVKHDNEDKYEYSNLSLFTLLTATVAWADVEINATNFPDAKFRVWLRWQPYGRDGVLTEAEIAGVTSIEVGYKNIQNLKGIEYFTALTRLFCDRNPIKGAAMDALVESLPTVEYGESYVIYNKDERNVMSKAQVAAVKAKGWTTKKHTGAERCYFEDMVETRSRSW